MINRRVIVIIVLATVGIVVISTVAMFGFWSRDTLKEPMVSDILEEKIEIIGKSVEGRSIESYTYGDGETQLVFVGGIHGGYEWNTTLLAWQLMDYFKNNSDFIPKNLKISVIPSANPDGLYKIIGKEGRFTLKEALSTKTPYDLGRFNANNVDLNRNFDCKWQPESTWQNKKVSAGTNVFSEPEAVALRDFFLKIRPSAVVFWHSQANAVYASYCTKGILPETIDIMEAYSKGSGYKAMESFDAYEVTGDAEGWLASIEIPTITVELKTHETVEWQENLAGIKEVFKYYSKGGGI